MKHWKRVRTALVLAAVVGAGGFGVLQATASASASSSGAACNTWACRTECAPFGGQLVPGGPGKPLRCSCCG